MQGSELTGLPSIDKPWLKYYKPDAEARALDTPNDKSIYRYYMENVFTNPEFPVLKYFNATFSTQQFVDLIHTWAKAFLAVGVQEDEMVPVYGTWSPEIAAIFFALNMIGAYPYYEKLEITSDAMRMETAGAKVAVIFEPLWNDVAKEVFSEDRFEKVFMICLADSMRYPLKLLVKGKSVSFQKSCSDSNKYIFAEQMKELASTYSGPVEVPFKKDRIALITSSSGTTSSVVKGIMDSNESALANVLSMVYSEPGYFAGKECFVTLPPTASTAINSFFLLPLCKGMTVRIDPRADEENWTKLLLEYKPSLSINTGSLWYSFYRQINEMCKNGNTVDLSFADTFIMGGSGVTPQQLSFMNEVAKRCNAPHAIVSGYGCSEYFGVVTVDKYQIDYHSESKEIIDVGIPIPGAVLSVFDDEGNELSYGQRGELWVKGPAIMHGYFRKPEQTKQMFHGEWLKIGDIGEMDENGYVFVYGRKKDCVNVEGKTVFLFDLANAIRREFQLSDCMVEAKTLKDGEKSIVVYCVEKEDMENRELCRKINAFMQAHGIGVDGYLFVKDAFPISPTTLKPQKRVLEGFVNYGETDNAIRITYSLTEENDVLVKHILK